ncbi:CA3A1 regulator, partial [Polypterus senegalus]
MILKANVIIAGPKNSKGDDPYTLQYEGCGKEGRYIHFTPNFLLNDKFIKAYGPRGKVFVHEWAHLRWGVFNEYNEYQPFYREGDHYRVTKCPKDLSGKVCLGNDCSKCNLENANDPPKEGCVFLPEKYQETSSSIMYTPVVKSVNQFCNKSNHNQDAPNDQNRFCKLKSAWEVILESEDFRNANEATDLSSLEPQFTVMQESQTILCLVLDISGSMRESQRLERLQQASTLFIEIAKEGSFIGIVTFNNIAYVKKGLTYISGDDVRKTLVNTLPTRAEGGTNICSGLRDAFEVLSEDDGSTAGDEILLLTDGEDSGISSCFEAVKTSGTIVHTIALGPSAAKELEMLSEMTNGKKNYASDNFNSNGLLEAFMELSEEQIKLESTGGTQEPGDSLFGETYIDSEVGFNTTFLVTWQTDVKPDIFISDPDGKEYSIKDFKLGDKTTVGTLIIPGKAKTGKWLYNIQNTANQAQPMTISITSQPSGAKSEPVIVKTNLQQSSEPPYTVVIYAEVFKNFMPVHNANVTAIIETASTNIITVTLQDNGAGADLVKNDGIYSSFMTDYDGTGRYNFKVQVSKFQNETKAAAGHTSGAMYVQGYLENGTVHLNPPKPVVADEDFPVENFVRTKSGGTFMVKVVPPANKDVFPPCQITDLSAELLNNTVILAWTAPGDDMDKGTVAEYEIRTSKQAVDLRDNFHNATKINTSSIIPLTARSREQFSFDLEEEEKVNNSVIFFAVVSHDESLLASDVSNIAQVIELVDNGYRNIVIAIHKAVPENPQLIDNIKANIIIAGQKITKGDEPYTLQYEGCGKEGLYIHFTPNFLLNDTFMKTYGPRGKVFVHEWAHLRWGVFDEYNEYQPFYREGEHYRVTIGRLERLQQASTLFIEKIAKEESFIGIVTFNNAAYVMKGLTYVSGDDVRKTLVNALPTRADGGTNICSGLREALQVLRNDDGSAEGDEIVLLTDGEDSGISSCFEVVKTSGTKVHTIALGPSAAKELEMLSEMTDGKKYYASDNFNSNGLLEAFMELSEEQIQLESTGGTQEPGDSLVGDTYIDIGVGFNTNFLVTWQTDVKPDISISDPDGIKYSTKDFKLEEKATVGTLIIPGKAKTGKWSYRIENTARQPQSMTISITSQPSGAQSEPVIVKTNLQQTNESSYTAAIYVEVFKNLMPVRHANVTAIIEPASTKIIPVILKDNGAGADLVAGDGIYSSYMTDYDGIGRDNFKVQVSKLQNEIKAAAGHTSGAMYVQGYLENGTVHLNPPKPVVVDDEDFPIEDFVRTKSGGTFMVKVVPPANQDVFPPCQITDLSAELINNTVNLAWTAPGDDMDKGTVAEYEIRKSKQAVHLRDNFHNATQVNTSSIIPLIAGSREQLSFDLEEEEKVNNSVIFFAVVSRDESLLASDVSNIAQVVIYHPSPKSRDPDTSNQNRKLTVGLAVSLVTIILCSVLGLIALIINKRNSGMMVLDEEHVRKKLNIVAEA